MTLPVSPFLTLFILRFDRKIHGFPRIRGDIYEIYQTGSGYPSEGIDCQKWELSLHSSSIGDTRTTSPQEGVHTQTRVVISKMLAHYLC